MLSPRVASAHESSCSRDPRTVLSLFCLLQCLECVAASPPAACLEPSRWCGLFPTLLCPPPVLSRSWASLGGRAPATPDAAAPGAGTQLPPFLPGAYLSSSLRLCPCPLPPGESFSVSCPSFPSRSGPLPPTPCGAFPCARPVVSVRERFFPLAGPHRDTVAASGPPQRRRRPGTRDWGRAVAAR